MTEINLFASNIPLKKLVLLLLLSPLISLSQGRKYSNAFLEIGIDARAMAMSNAVIASTNDISAAYWNPAGLVGITDGWQAAAMHAEYFASIAQYDYAAYGRNIDEYSSAAISFIRFGVDDILNTTDLIDQNGNVDYDRITRFSAADYALIGSYARKSKKIKNFNYGANFKIVYRQIGEFANSIGFGFDAGLQYKIGKWQLGASFKDITTTFNAWTINEEAFGESLEITNSDLPTENLELTIPRMLLGVARAFNINEKYRLHSELSADFTFGGKENTLVSSSFANINPNLGLELGYLNFVFLRTGFGNVKRLSSFTNEQSFSLQPNLGIGFLYRGISIDYALTDIGSASGTLYSNIFSLKFNFDDFKKS
jgi:hypothetical protein